MPRTIEIPDELYARLERLARGFDSPASVIARLLDDSDRRGSSADAIQDSDKNEIPGRHLFSNFKDHENRYQSASLPENSQIQKSIVAVAKSLGADELGRYCEADFSKHALGLNFPLFKRVTVGATVAEKKAAVRDGVVPRWSIKHEFVKEGYCYFVCTQWYGRHDRKVNEWLVRNGAQPLPFAVRG